MLEKGGRVKLHPPLKTRLTGRAAQSKFNCFMSTGGAALTVAKFVRLGLLVTPGALSWHNDVGLVASVLHANGLCNIVSVDKLGRVDLATSCCD